REDPNVKRSSLWTASLFPLLFVSCLASSKEIRTVQAPPAAPAPPGEDAEAKRVKLGRDLELARAKLENGRADLRRTEQTNAETTAAAETDLAISQRALASFDEKSAKLCLERARLEFTQVQDSVEEAKEELQQLELMYEKTDLADKTKEFVIQRN